MKLFKNIRVIILLIAIVLSTAAINPRPWQTGVAIRSVDHDSAASEAGMIASNTKTSPVLRERIIAIDGIPIETELDFTVATAALIPNTSVLIETNKNLYTLITQPLLNITILPEQELINVTEEVDKNGTKVNETHSELRNKTRSTIIGTKPLGLGVYDAPKSNIRYGLDITGGARVLVQPEQNIPDEQLDTVIDTIKERLNVFGLSDIVVRSVSDLAGNQYILVEIAGASERDVRDLILQQGKFDARVGNTTVFSGGNDITYVCRSPDCSGISQRGCQPVQDGYACEFQFAITLAPEAAERQANATKNLAVVARNGEQYLEKPLDLYLDDTLVDSLQISAGLKGSAVTKISISGSGVGATERAAAEDAFASMKKLQTVLITGSLPVKLNVVKTDSISAELGDEFVKNALLVIVAAILVVTLTIIVRYRDPKIAIPVTITVVSELLIIIGVAVLFRLSFDLAAIAGIIITIGTGVDHQIVIADEVLSNKASTIVENWKAKIKKAFFIIFTSYFTVLAAMIPLFWAGAGLVRQFAIITIVGSTIGVLITRPAFAAIMERLENKE